MALFARALDRWASRLHTREIADYLVRLRGLSDTELGLVVVTAAHLRNSSGAVGLRLLDPALALSERPDLALLISRHIGKAQKNGRMHDAAGWFVWLHTLRAEQRLELKAAAREMWAELERGFPHMDGGVSTFISAFGTVPDTTNADVFPVGFEPIRHI